MSARKAKQAGVPPVVPRPKRKPASFTPKSCSRKLAPIKLVPTAKRPRPVAVGPFVAITNTSIQATCSDGCPFKGADCYVQTGFTKFPAAELDFAARDLTAEAVIAEEVRLVDRSFRGGQIPQDGRHGGRDLRLHVGGDVGSEAGARLLDGAAQRWRKRRGGAVWTYTHWMREIPRAAWGSEISVLGSVEIAEDIEVARHRGYAAAITLATFPSEKAFTLPGSTALIIPCPAETRGATCARCRLCLDDRKLLEKNWAIAFQKHGPGTKGSGHGLVQLRRKRESATRGTAP